MSEAEFARLGAVEALAGLKARRFKLAAYVDALTERAQRLKAHLQSALGGQPFLVVLDDAWRPEDLLDFEYFSTPGSAVLLTTRDEVLARRYADARSRLVRVQELDEPAALDLLARAAEVPAGAMAGLRELAQAVGYLPLALVLMARDLATHAGQERWIRQSTPDRRCRSC